LTRVTFIALYPTFDLYPLPFFNSQGTVDPNYHNDAHYTAQPSPSSQVGLLQPRGNFSHHGWVIFLRSQLFTVFIRFARRFSLLSPARAALKFQNSVSPVHPVLLVNALCGAIASNVVPSQWSTMTDPFPAILTILTIRRLIYCWMFLYSLPLCLPLFFLLSATPRPNFKPGVHRHDQSTSPTLLVFCLAQPPTTNHPIKVSLDFTPSIVSWQLDYPFAPSPPPPHLPPICASTRFLDAPTNLLSPQLSFSKISCPPTHLRCSTGYSTTAYCHVCSFFYDCRHKCLMCNDQNWLLLHRRM
jgi:hypothetical protein